MKHPFFYIIICLFSLSLIAQNNSLRGKVFFLNSGKTPAVGVEISGEVKDVDNANTVYSASDGAYYLIFPKVGVGHPVELKVGDTNADGQAIELVNEEEVSLFMIPENPEDQFEIIVCRRGERDAVAQRYYGIIRSSADEALKKKRAEWSSLVAQKEKNYDAIAELRAEIGRLEKQADSISLYKEAYRMASINKDNANKRVLKYLRFLDEGKSIQEARKVLKPEKAIKELRRSGSRFKAAIQELQTRASASKSIFDYKDAIKCYDTIIHYSEEMRIDRLKMAGYYTEIAKVILYDGNYAKALEYQKKSLSIQEGFLDAKNLSLANSYNNIAAIYQSLGEYKTALNYCEKAMNIKENVLDSRHLSMGNSYNNLASIYSALNQYDKALVYHKKSLSIWEEHSGLKHYNLAATYSSIGNIYRVLIDYEKALEYHKKAIAIAEDNLDPEHPFVAVLYLAIGNLYRDLRRYETALEYHEKTIGLQEKMLNPKHPDLAASYNEIASTYYRSRQYTIALHYYQKSLNIRKEILEPEHTDLATTYNDIGTTYLSLGQYEKALEYLQKAIAIQKEVLGSKHPHLGNSYRNIAYTYTNMKNFQKAIVFMEKCLAIFRETLPENHSYQKRTINALEGIYTIKGLDDYNNKHYPQAIESYQKAATVLPEIKTQYFYNNIGTAYAKNKQFKEAHNAFTKYEKLFPNKGRAYRNWAMYYALQGDKEKALMNLQKAVKLGYNDLKWFKTDDSMDSLRDEKVFIELVKKLEKEQHN